MYNFGDLKTFFSHKDYKLIIAADAEPFVDKKNKDNQIEAEVPAGGVAVAFDPLARSSGCLFVARGKTPEDKKTVDSHNKVQNPDKSYVLKRLFFSEKDTFDYYYGYSNQTLWPLCHVAFERPIFSDEWFKGFQKVNEVYARSIKEELKGKTLIWLNDYQLSLVPKYLGKTRDTVIAFFWHIPWPTWEVFRILPQKKEILESLLLCDFIGFHRGYQARNFLQCVERELEARIDRETNKVYYKNHVTTVSNLPMGVDTDVIKSLVEPEENKGIMKTLLSKAFGLISQNTESSIEKIFQNNKVMLGVDRLDYTKGILLRLQAINLFFQKYPQYRGKVSYIGILAPSRESIPSYISLKKDMFDLIETINKKYQTKHWVPVNLIIQTFSRKEIMNWYKKANICLVTPLDDGMNLVSKEFVIAATQSKNPGMLILSQFAGSAIDLTAALIINPYDLDEVAEAIKKGLDMSGKERKERMMSMQQILDERNVYEWARDFLRASETAAKENRTLVIPR